MTTASPGQATETPGSEIRYLITPNRSMDRRQAAWLVAAVSCATFGVGGALAFWYGAWPILPFAGFEVALLAYVVHRVQVGCEDRELVVLGDTHVDLTRRHGRVIESHRFSRYWVRVDLRRPSARNLPSRLEIGSHGKFVEIGACLTDDERASLADHLVARLAGAAAENHFRTSTGVTRQ